MINFQRHEVPLDFELNLAPVIDCFTVLIAFVMISTSFASVGILDAGVIAGGDTPKSDSPPKNRLSVELGKDGMIQLRVIGTASKSPELKAENAEQLQAHLTKLKTDVAELNDVTLTAADSVPYNEIVRVMESLRGTFPTVALGGF